MKLSDELKMWGYHSSLSKKGKEQHLEMSGKAEQLEAELTDYLKICQNYVTDLGVLQIENEALKRESSAVALLTTEEQDDERMLAR